MFKGTKKLVTVVVVNSSSIDPRFHYDFLKSRNTMNNVSIG